MKETDKIKNLEDALASLKVEMCLLQANIEDNIIPQLNRYKKALTEIKQGKGRFSMDDLTHARNTIQDMKRIAEEALETV